MIAAAVSFRFPGCNWLHSRDRLKKKAKRLNIKTVFEATTPESLDILYNGTDSVPQDRPKNKKSDSKQRGRLKNKTEI